MTGWLVIWDLFAKGRTDGALVRLITPIAARETVDEAQDRLNRFFRDSYPRPRAPCRRVIVQPVELIQTIPSVDSDQTS